MSQAQAVAEAPEVKALYMVCVHLGLQYKWVPTSEGFECPCHGTKYLRSSARIDGPARRNFDGLVVEMLDAQGDVLARTETRMNGFERASESAPLEAVTGKYCHHILTLCEGNPEFQGAKYSQPY